MGNIRNRGSNLRIDPNSLLESIESETPMVPTATLKPSVHIRRESLKLNHNDSTSLFFIYDSYTDVTINFYFFAIESLKNYGVTECYYIDLLKYPNPVVHNLTSGLNQPFPDEVVNFDFAEYSLTELTFADKKAYPLIIEIVKLI